MTQKLNKLTKLLYNSVVSKKLFAFLVATLLLWFGKISENIWEMIAIVFLSAQAVFDTATTWKHGYKLEKATRSPLEEES